MARTYVAANFSPRALDGANGDDGGKKTLEEELKNLGNDFKKVEWLKLGQREKYEAPAINVNKQLSDLHAEVLDRPPHGDGSVLKIKLHMADEQHEKIYCFGTPNHNEEADEIPMELNVDMFGEKKTSEDFAAWKIACKRLTACQFVQILEALQPSGEQADFLQSLTVPINIDNYEGSPVTLPWTKNAFVTTLQQIENWVNGVELVSPIEGQIHWSQKRKFEFLYTPAQKIVRPLTTENEANDLDRLYVLKALVDAPRDAEVFSAPIGYAICRSAWTRVYPRFVVNRMLDILFLLLLLWVGRAVRTGFYPGTVTVWLIALLNCKTALWCIFEFLMVLHLYGWKAGFSRYFTGWNVNIFLLEAFTVAAIWSALRETEYYPEPCLHKSEIGEGGKSCWWRDHPILLMFVVMGKSTYLLCTTLCYAWIGEYIMPAYAALISRQAVHFYMLLFLCVMSSFLSYYMLPIEENIVQEGMDLGIGSVTLSAFTPLMKTFIKVFRLNIMGDFDLWELEGIDEVVQAKDNMKWSNMTGDAAFAEIDDGDPSPTYHFGISLFLALNGLVVNIMLMNLFIGLLSTVYEELYPQRYQTVTEFKGTFAFKELLWMAHMPTFAKACQKALCQSDEAYSAKGEYVIAYPTELEGEVFHRPLAPYEKRDQIREALKESVVSKQNSNTIPRDIQGLDDNYDFDPDRHRQ